MVVNKKDTSGTFLSFSEEDTKQIAQSLSKFAKKGMCFSICGDLGYGKTTFAKFLMQSLNPDISDISSPTFNIIQTYECNLAEIWHVDCYRIKSSDEFNELGLEEAFQNCITIIEWPEIIDNYLPTNRIKIRFSITEDNNRMIHYELPKVA
ncbi:hypothetical protein FACS1894122_01250 [Alphaproteobacteria bacterium]|nr:hypothetical protein FACS1894122_01250 [Alphaproteobacteria bacterium]